MNRLTSEDGQLYACGNGLCSDGNTECANCRYANEAFLKLAKYENVGLQPEHIDSLELKDLKANSVRIVNMDKVKIADLSKDNLQGE